MASQPMSTSVLTSKASPPLKSPTVPKLDHGFLYLPPLTIPRRPWGTSRLGVAGSGLSGPVMATSLAPRACVTLLQNAEHFRSCSAPDLIQRGTEVPVLSHLMLGPQV